MGVRTSTEGVARSMRRDGPRVRCAHAAVRYRCRWLPKRYGGSRWCSGVSIVAAARTGEMQRRRRIDRPLLDGDRLIRRRPLRDPRELEGDAGGAVGGVVGVMLVGATALHMRGRAPRSTCFRRRRQERCHALSREREAGGQDEDTRTWAAEATEHAVHYRKLAKGDLTVTTRDERRVRHSIRGSPAKRSSRGGRARRREAEKIYVLPWILPCIGRARR
jgi:hypothetical protein